MTFCSVLIATTRSGLGSAAAYTTVRLVTAVSRLHGLMLYLLVLAAFRRADSGDGRLLLNMCCSLEVVLISYFHYLALISAARLASAVLCSCGTTSSSLELFQPSPVRRSLQPPC